MSEKSRLAGLAFVVGMVASSVQAATFTVSNDTEFAQAISQVSSGDVIELMGGNYSNVVIHGGKWNKVIVGGARIYRQVPTLTGAVTIRSKDPNNQAVFRSLQVRNSDYWQFDNLSIRPGQQHEYFQAVELDGDNIAFKNSTVSFGDSTGWTASDWINSAGNAIRVGGDNVLVQNNTLVNVSNGIQFDHSAQNGRAIHNTVDGIGRDASRALGDNTLIENNLFRNFKKINGNHDDCLQSWATSNTNSVKGVVVRGNLCIANEDPNDPLYSPAQGYVSFNNGVMEDWLIENNILSSSLYQGIAVFQADNVVVRNNTIIDDNPATNGEDKKWIRILPDGSGPVTSVIEKNISNNYDGGGVIDVSDNITLEMHEYDDWFVDWRNFDFTLKSSLATAGYEGYGATPTGAGSTIDVSSVLASLQSVQLAGLSSLAAPNFGPAAPDFGPAAAVPVPAAGLLLVSGVAGLALLGRRKRR